MKKRTIGIGLLAMCLLAGCGRKETDPGQEPMPYPSFAASDYVELGDYRNLTVEMDHGDSLSEDMLTDLAMENLRAYLGSADWGMLSEGTVEADSYVRLAYTCRDSEGEVILSATEDGIDAHIPENPFSFDIYEELAGRSVGDTVEVERTYDGDFANMELAGKTVTFTVTILGIRPVPEPSDAAIGQASDGTYTTMESFLEEQREDMRRQYGNLYEKQVGYRLTTEIKKTSQVTGIPEELGDWYRNHLLCLYRQRADSDGESLDEYLEENGMTVGEIRDMTKERVRSDLGDFLLYSAIAEREGYALSDTAYRESLEETARNNGWASAEAMLEVCDESYVRQLMLCNQTVKKLVEGTAISLKE